MRNTFSLQAFAVMRYRFLFCIVLLVLSRLAFGDSINVNMTFLYPGGNNSGGYYTYPYYCSINGGSPTRFLNHVTQGEPWAATVGGLLKGQGMFGKNVLDSKAAGIIYLDVLHGSVDANVGSWALWNLFTNGITNDPAVLALDKQALHLAKHTPAGYFEALVLYTLVGAKPGSGPQEYIGYNPNFMVTHEPTSLLLLSTGLIGIATVVRRKLAHS